MGEWFWCSALGCYACVTEVEPGRKWTVRYR
jgi:hypothetical protein